MKIGDIPPHELRERLRGDGVSLRTGPIVTRIRSSLDAVVHGIGLHYAAHEVAPDDGFADFHVSVDRPRTRRRWFHPQVEFRLDDASPFSPLPGDQGFPMLEWGLNWCVTGLCHQYLSIHAAVIERAGFAMILPAPSGSGKSTLCAGLIHRGWRLLSDELTLIDPASGRIVPLPRPVSLKNASIDVIRQFAPEAVFGRAVSETTKGTVCHFRPPAEAVARGVESPLPRWVVLPRFVAGSASTLVPLTRGKALMRLIENSFNYNLHGARGFAVLADLVERCECYEFSYSRLDSAAELFAALADGADRTAPDVARLAASHGGFAGGFNGGFAGGSVPEPPVEPTPLAPTHPPIE